MDLETPLDRVLGGRTAKPLADTLALHTVGDLLHHYPRRYAERGQLTAFDELVVDEHATVFAEVRKLEERRLRPKLLKTDVISGQDLTTEAAVTKLMWALAQENTDELLMSDLCGEIRQEG